MVGRLRFRRGAVIAVATAGGLAAVGVVSVATGAIPGGDGKINACYANGNGELRVVDEGKACPKNWSPLNWNQQGVQGPLGTPGQDGQPGPQGEQGPQGPSGTSLALTSRTLPSHPEVPGGNEHTTVLDKEIAASGNYVVTATVDANTPLSSALPRDAAIFCEVRYLSEGASHQFDGALVTQITGSVDLAMTGAGSIPSGANLQVACQGSGAFSASADMTAIKVDQVQ